MKLIISLASRGRPQQLLETIGRSIMNWSQDNTVMMVQLDADDGQTLQILNMSAPHVWFVGPNGPRVFFDVRPREDTIAAKWNRAMSVPADVYLVAADDDPYITPGYDGKILEAAQLFPDGIGMVYGHNANASFSGVVAPTAKLVEKLGYIQPEHFPYWFCDHWTDDLARLLGRISFADVRTDQSKAGKTQEMREPAWWATWFDAAHLLRRKEAFAIINGDDFQETVQTKERLRRLHPRIEFFSQWINNNVRGMGEQMKWQPQSPLDERYLRVKQKAIDLLPAMLDGMEPQMAAAYKAFLIPPTTIANIPQAFAPSKAA